MKPITVSTTVARPRQEVYEFLEPLANHEAFTDHMLTDWESLGPDKVAVSSKAGGRTERVEIQATEAVPPERLAEQGTGGGGKRTTQGTYVLKEAGPDATDVQFTLEVLEAPALERLLLPLFAGRLRKDNQKAMDRLKTLLEGERAAPSD